MLVFDGNMLRQFLSASESGERLRARVDASGDDASLTVVTIEESMRGWLAELNRRSASPHEQIEVYRRMHMSVDVFAKWTVLGWDKESADLFLKLRRENVRIGTRDLKIACITLAHDALLLTRNTVDFAQVPGLRFENWAD
ncbi:type II toxin-antitoxin system VapC family toxin [Prosthecobacter sp.]|uniref:type II toxin-antitoxin system VapC family toxin n=1 Tax=Prosthecobacter sp. TaxID=1965333 RepID=UPI003784B7DE